MELKLTNVARASLEELRRDYEDYLRQHQLGAWPPDYLALKRFKAHRCSTVSGFEAWVEEELNETQTATDPHRRSVSVRAVPPASVSVRGGPCGSTPSPRRAELEANGLLSLLNVCCYLLDRQIAAQAEEFEREGGFTERLYRRRKEARDAQGR